MGGGAMSDANATIKAVDEAMDIMDEVSKEIHDLKAHICFDINELIAAVEREKWRSEEWEENRNQSEALGELCYECKKWGEELTEEWTGLCMSLADLADNAKHVMGEYMRKLNKISRTTEPAQGCIGRPGSEYYVVVVDSRKYPQTAEHIKRAQKMGFSEYVTLDRNGTDERRKNPLRMWKGIAGLTATSGQWLYFGKAVPVQMWCTWKTKTTAVPARQSAGR